MPPFQGLGLVKQSQVVACNPYRALPWADLFRGLQGLNPVNTRVTLNLGVAGLFDPRPEGASDIISQGNALGGNRQSCENLSPERANRPS